MTWMILGVPPFYETSSCHTFQVCVLGIWDVVHLLEIEARRHIKNEEAPFGTMDADPARMAPAVVFAPYRTGEISVNPRKLVKFPPTCHEFLCEVPCVKSQCMLRPHIGIWFREISGWIWWRDYDILWYGVWMIMIWIRTMIWIHLEFRW